MVQVSPLAKADDTPHAGKEHGSTGTHISRTILEIRVTDNGQGVPAEQLERIFERFHRVATRLTREFNRIGLGMTICKRIVELQARSSGPKTGHLGKEARSACNSQSMELPPFRKDGIGTSVKALSYTGRVMTPGVSSAGMAVLRACWEHHRKPYAEIRKEHSLL